MDGLTTAQRELRNENAKVMDAVAAGETFVVTRNGASAHANGLDLYSRNGDNFSGIDHLVRVVEIERPDRERELSVTACPNEPARG